MDQASQAGRWSPPFDRHVPVLVADGGFDTARELEAVTRISEGSQDTPFRRGRTVR